MQIIRCSSLPRIMKCPASKNQPEIKISSAGTPARLGTAVHEAAARIVEENRNDPPALDLHLASQGLGNEFLKEAINLSWAAVRTWNYLSKQISMVAVEQQLTLELGKFKLQGTADILGYDDKGRLAVIDWKTGYKTDTDFSDQLKGYALLASHAMSEYEGKDIVIIVAYLREETIEVVELTFDELLVWKDRLLATLESEDYTVGGHCQYCPVNDCKARAIETRRAVSLFTDKQIEVSKYGEYWNKMKLIKDAVSRFENLVKDYVKEHGSLELPENKELVIREIKKKKLHTKEAMIYLAEKGIDLGGLGTAINLKRAEVEKILLKDVPRSGKAEAREQLYKDLEEIGALEIKTETRVETRKKAENE